MSLVKQDEDFLKLARLLYLIRIESQLISSPFMFLVQLSILYQATSAPTFCADEGRHAKVQGRASFPSSSRYKFSQNSSEYTFNNAELFFVPSSKLLSVKALFRSSLIKNMKLFLSLFSLHFEIRSSSWWKTLVRLSLAIEFEALTKQLVPKQSPYEASSCNGARHKTCQVEKRRYPYQPADVISPWR